MKNKWMKVVNALCVAVLLAGTGLPVHIYAEGTEDTQEDGGGVVVDAHSENKTEPPFGDITAEGENALTVKVSNGHNATVTVDGNVTATSSEASEVEQVAGVEVNVNGNNSSADISIDGTVTSDSIGAEVNNNLGATAELTVTGDVTVEGTGDKDVAVSAQTITVSQSTTTVDINGNVQSTADGLSAGAISFAGNAETEVNVDGEVDASQTGLIIGAAAVSWEEKPASASVEVRIGGDLSSKNGPAIEAAVDMTSNSDVRLKGDAVVIVEGTISSEKDDGPIIKAGFPEGYSDSDIISSTLDTLDLTVWKIDIKDGQTLAADSERVEDKEFEKRINYIVKLEPNEKFDYAAVKQDNSALDTVTATINGEEYSYDVAHESEKVYLKINTKGYRIKGAYNVDGEKKEIDHDSEGNYYIEVPRVGGIYLSVEGDNLYNITYDLDGGTYDGKTGSVIFEAEYGTLIKLPAPTKDGYEFDHWEGSRYEAGAEYEVADDHKFTAIWKKIDSSSDDKKSEDSSTAGGGDYILPVIEPAVPEQTEHDTRIARIPKTSDEQDLQFWTMMLLAMMGTAFVSSVALIKMD